MTQPASTSIARPAWDVKYMRAMPRTKAEARAWNAMAIAGAAPGSELEKQIAVQHGVLPPKNIMG